MKVRDMTLFGLLAIGSVVVLLSGWCSSRRFVEDTMTAMIGYRIEFPDSLSTVNADQIEDSALLSYKGKAKLVMSVSSDECTTCTISKMYLADTLFRIKSYDDFVPMVIIRPEESQRDSILEAIRFNWFEFPVYEDREGRFMKINPVIPEDGRFHTFLVGRDDRILLVGNPMLDERIMKLYMETLTLKTDSL